jgi:hypothetical protein
MAESNGGPHALTQKPRRPSLTLELDLSTFTVKLGGDIPNMDCGLCMLDMAARELRARMEEARRAGSLAINPSEFLASMRGNRQS